jgi:hypothetical protein
MPDDPDTLLAQAAEAIRRVEEWSMQLSGDRRNEAWAHQTGTLPLMRAMYDTAELLIDGHSNDPVIDDTPMADIGADVCREIIRVANEICGEQP